MRTRFGQIMGILKELARTYTRKTINSVEADKDKKEKSWKGDNDRV